VAKHRRRARRKWSRDLQWVQVDVSLTLGALTQNDLIGVAMTTVSNEAFRALSVQGTWSLHNLTPGEGPIVVGVAHGDYTDSEVEAAVEADESMVRADKIAQELADRLVRRVGSFPGALAEEVLYNGVEIYKRLNWAHSTGQALRMWAHNRSGANLNTGGVVNFTGKLLIRWL